MPYDVPQNVVIVLNYQGESIAVSASEVTLEERCILEEADFPTTNGQKIKYLSPATVLTVNLDKVLSQGGGLVPHGSSDEHRPGQTALPEVPKRIREQGSGEQDMPGLLTHEQQREDSSQQ